MPIATPSAPPSSWARVELAHLVDLRGCSLAARYVWCHLSTYLRGRADGFEISQAALAAEIGLTGKDATRQLRRYLDELVSARALVKEQRTWRDREGRRRAGHCRYWWYAPGTAPEPDTSVRPQPDMGVRPMADTSVRLGQGDNNGKRSANKQAKAPDVEHEAAGHGCPTLGRHTSGGRSGRSPLSPADTRRMRWVVAWLSGVMDSEASKVGAIPASEAIAREAWKALSREAQLARLDAVDVGDGDDEGCRERAILDLAVELGQPDTAGQAAARERVATWAGRSDPRLLDAACRDAAAAGQIPSTRGKWRVAMAGILADLAEDQNSLTASVHP